MALSNPYEGIRRPGAVGSPLPGVSVKIEDEGELMMEHPLRYSLRYQGPNTSNLFFHSCTVHPWRLCDMEALCQIPVS